MSLDGAFIRHLKKELEYKIIGRRIYKIYQPSKHEISMYLRGMDDTVKLIISSSANSPRINITDKNIDNPGTPPPFCMLLRKKILSSKVVKIDQKHLERVLCITLETKDEMGYDTSYKLVVEIMGKYSNIILLDNDFKIIDSIKRVTSSMSSKRLVLPGLDYKEPPNQDKICVLNSSSKDILKEILSFDSEKKLSSCIMSCMQGISNIVCKSIISFIRCSDDVKLKELSVTEKEKLAGVMGKFSSIIKNTTGHPYLIKLKNGKKDISFVEVPNEDFKKYDSFSNLIDDYYYEKAQIDRINSTAGSLIKTIENLISSRKNKIKKQEMDLKECEGKEKFKLYGDLLTANIYKVKKGMENLSVVNFFSKSFEEINIKLDSRLDGSGNAQKYYKKYKRFKTAEKILLDQIKLSQSDILYLENVLDSLVRSESETEIQEIYDELCEEGYIKYKNKMGKKTSNKKKVNGFIEFTSPSGYKILIGRNCKQNEKLTYKTAGKKDLWFHVKDMPGSHTVMFTNGLDAKNEDILFAAKLCAMNSKARSSSKAEVDYTFISNVKKPNNYRPGMAIYKNYKTIYVSID